MHHLFVTLLKLMFKRKKTTDSCNNMLSGTSIIEWHIKKQMYERKYIVCLVSFLIMCFCLRVKRCDCGGGGCFVWGCKWQLGNSGSAMVSKERHNRNAGTGWHSHNPSHPTHNHISSPTFLPKLWPHRWQHCRRFHLCHKWRLRLQTCRQAVPTHHVKQITCMKILNLKDIGVMKCSSLEIIKEQSCRHQRFRPRA